MKKLESDKNESFNIIREKESITRKVKKAKNVHGKPLGRDEKPQVSKREYPLLFQALYNVKNGSFSLYNYGVLPKREVFSLPHFLTNFLLFFLSSWKQIWYFLNQKTLFHHKIDLNFYHKKPLFLHTIKQIWNFDKPKSIFFNHQNMSDFF